MAKVYLYTPPLGGGGHLPANYATLSPATMTPHPPSILVYPPWSGVGYTSILLPYICQRYTCIPPLP